MTLQRLLSLLAAVLVLVCAVVMLRAPGWPGAFAAPAAAPACTGQPVFAIGAFHTVSPGYAHALTAAICATDASAPSGTRQRGAEAGRAADDRDVRWPAMECAARNDRAAATDEAIRRNVRKLGNPTIFRDARGDLVLIFASASIGGWSGTGLNLMRSPDDGETWSPPRRLTTTAVFNLGTNVRSPAVPAAGGSVLVPISHEFLRHYPAMMLLDGDGRVRGLRRIGVKYEGTQPFVLVLDEHRAVAFFRTRYHRPTRSSRTDDAGFSWSEPVETSVRNYDKPVAIGRLGGGRYLMIHNYVIPEEVSGARDFMLELSEDDRRSWRPFDRLEYQLDRKVQAKYPWLMAGADNYFHLLFTLGDTRTGSDLVHARFNRDWIAARAGLPCQ